MAPSIVKHFNRRLSLSVVLIAVSQFNYGFDNQAFAQTQAMNAFTEQFGDYNPKTEKYYLKTYWLSLFNSLPFIGFAVGLVFGSMISARWGRRMAMFCMSLYALVSATIVVTAQTKGQIMVGRILNYVYIGCELATVPVFQSEIVPAPVRGLAVSTYQLSINAGGLVINGICRATSSNSGRSAYTIPYGLFYIVPCIIISFIWLIPESPRWLMTRDRLDEAREAHRKYREGTMSDQAIEREFKQLYAAFLAEHEQGHTVELFKGTNLKRTAIVLGMNFFQQATGQTFASQYGTIFIKSLGTVNPFSVSTGNSAIGIFILIVALLTADKLGRRYMLFIGSFVQTAALFTMGGLGLQSPPSFGHKGGEVAMLVVFGAGFLYSWGPITYVVTTELPALRLRDRSQRVASMMNIFMNFLVTFVVPYLLNAPYANLHSRVGFIFGSISVLSGVFAYFCVPECKGRSLEEIDAMFLERVPVRKFRRHPRIRIEVDAASESGGGVLEDCPTEQLEEKAVSKD
ncbi:Hexose transporter HXT13 [Pleurostoma richardsiae]|uniref:Hexose transporter HXT13 n=1 Tax=Pleurostoma richardsiae TaxID=41990 RepID=A0AA38RQI7_9PEZI|nr:Hexose transporter HXT13 [Pleurostoma richardsiae]